jgi:hypothetical protein
MEKELQHYESILPSLQGDQRESANAKGMYYDALDAYGKLRAPANLVAENEKKQLKIKELKSKINDLKQERQSMHARGGAFLKFELLEHLENELAKLAPPLQIVSVMPESPVSPFVDDRDRTPPRNRKECNSKNNWCNTMGGRHKSRRNTRKHRKSRRRQRKSRR